MDQSLKKVRDFAKECGCTPQNIYGHLRTYAAELEGHVFQGKGRQGQLLDEFAQDFLKSVMYPKEISTDATVARMAEEIERLRTALFKASEQSTEMLNELTQVKGENQQLRFDNSNFQERARIAEESEAEKTAKLEASQKETAEARQMAQKAQEENQELKRQLDEERAAKEQEMAAREATDAKLAEVDALPKWKKFVIGWKG